MFAKVVTAVALLTAALDAGAQWSPPTGDGTIHYSTGEVGIGTNTPEAALQVVSHAGSPLASQVLVGSGSPVMGASQTGYAAQNGGVKLFFGAQSGLGFLGTVTNTNFGVVVNNITQFYFAGGGRLSVNNSINNPVSNLDVKGNASLGAYAGVNGAPGNGMIVSGQVGIGTPSPEAGSALQIAGKVRFGSNAGGGYTDLRIATEAAGTLDGQAYDQINSITPVTIPPNGVTKRTALHIKGATASGQGTNSMDLIVDGNIAAKYQDVAEWVPVTTPMSPGTVVVLNLEHSNEVMPSARPYDTAVAGVVSAQPGLSLGVAGPSKALIATTGRVKVRVDATRRPIAIGDLLVTSDKPGHAMRSEPMDINGRKFHQPGTIVGKALEPLAGAQGEILVLLSLQ